MANLFVDPAVLASPQFGCSKEDFEGYVSQLTQWHELNNCEWSKIFFSSKTIKVLFDEGRYPIWPEVDKIITGFGIDYIQTKDIVVLVDSFLDKFIKIEEWLSLNDFLYEEITLYPDVENAASDAFKTVLSETLVLMVVKSHLNNEEQNLQLLITNTGLEKIGVQSTISLSSFANDFVLPDEFDINGLFRCSSEFDDLLIKINFSYLWINCDSNNGLKRLVHLHTTIKKRELNSISAMNSFEFGKHFIPSLTALHFKSETAKVERLLRVISDLILDMNLASTHAIRESSGGGSDQLQLKEFKGWRKDIDHEYHLHYWKKSNHIIFANVVTHNDFSISNW